MNNLNKVLITGILCQDLELRYTPDGTKTTNLRVAIHRKYKNKAQEIKEDTQFITVVAWQILAESCVKYLKKGSRIFVEGRLQTRKYTDKNQIEQTVTEITAETIEFLDKPERKEE